MHVNMVPNAVADLGRAPLPVTARDQGDDLCIRERVAFEANGRESGIDLLDGGREHRDIQDRANSANQTR